MLSPLPSGGNPSGDDLVTGEWATRWLSGERLAPYLAACDGDINRALDLYDWNVRLGQVLMRDISHFEVALRNSYDQIMTTRWGDDWLFDDSSPVRRPIMRRAARGELDANRINRKTIDAVLARLPSSATHGALVAGLTLGFWIHLTDRSHDVDLWRSGLYLAWPKGTSRRPTSGN